MISATLETPMFLADPRQKPTPRPDLCSCSISLQPTLLRQVQAEIYDRPNTLPNSLPRSTPL